MEPPRPSSLLPVLLVTWALPASAQDTGGVAPASLPLPLPEAAPPRPALAMVPSRSSPPTRPSCSNAPGRRSPATRTASASHWLTLTDDHGAGLTLLPTGVPLVGRPNAGADGTTLFASRELAADHGLSRRWVTHHNVHASKGKPLTGSFTLRAIDAASTPDHRP